MGSHEFLGPPELQARDLYLDLMKRCLTNWMYGHTELQPFRHPRRVPRKMLASLSARWLAPHGAQIVTVSGYDPAVRAEGRDWSPVAHTMIGLKRLDHLQRCLEGVLANHVPGDVIETGVWRGGATIFMRAVLAAYGVQDRAVWVADSFEGLPPPNATRYPKDAGDLHHTNKELAVPLETVQANFERYGLLDGQVRFLKGWFRDTLPTAPIDRLAVIRLDGDMYESTMDGLVHLYPKLSLGGYLIVDDYGSNVPCRQAVEDFRASHGIREALLRIDWAGVCWQRTQA